jgi:NADH-quinone oxidoreductase subunit E
VINHRIHIRENKPAGFSAVTMKKVRELMGRYPEGKQKSALLPILHLAQEETGGYLSVDVMDHIASILGIQPIEVYEVATFYSMFYLEKTGRYVIEVCQTGPCAMCGGEEILRYLKEKLQIGVGETTPDGLFTLRTVECLGACGYAPVIQVNTEFHEHLDRQRINRLLDELKRRATEPNPPETTWAGQYC